MQKTPITVTFFLNRSQPSQDGSCLIKMTVYQKPHKKRYSTEFHLTANEWDRLHAPKLKDEKLKETQKKLNALQANAEKVIEKIVPFSFTVFEEIFFSDRQVKITGQTVEKKALHLQSRILSDWFRFVIDSLNQNEQLSTAELYQTVNNSIIKFKGSITLHDVTPAFLLSYEVHLKKENKSLATIGIYMRHLRAIINGAIKEKIISKDNYPFNNYQIPIGQNVKKALKNDDISRILNCTPAKEDHQKALDYWIFSYLCNGMNFADIILLKPQNIKGNILSFYRKKTIRTKKKDLRPIKVGLSQRVLSVIERWRNTNPGNPYLFPILEADLPAKTIKNCCHKFIKWVNQRTHEIFDRLGIEEDFRTMAARHSFATVLKRKGAPTSYIKDALGHSIITTTENYLDSFEDATTLLYAEALIISTQEKS